MWSRVRNNEFFYDKWIYFVSLLLWVVFIKDWINDVYKKDLNFWCRCYIVGFYFLEIMSVIGVFVDKRIILRWLFYGYWEWIKLDGFIF